MKHAVIFDIDGTLLDSMAGDDRLYRQAVREVLGDIVLRPLLVDYDCVTDSGILLQILSDNELPAEIETMTQVKNAFFTYLQDYVALTGPFDEMPGAKSILRRVTGSSNHRLALATGSWRFSAELKLRSAGFDIGSAPLATSDDAINRTDIMRVALAALKEEFETVTYFGDGHWDERACRILGWSFCPVGPALGGIQSFDGLYTD